MYDKPIAVVTIACEARNQPHDAQVGVAASMFNRLRAGSRRYGQTIAAICMKRYQYSEYNDDSADNGNLLAVLALPEGDPVQTRAAAAFDEALLGVDPTGGATHYHDTSIPPPSWTLEQPDGRQAVRTCQIGALVFYKDVP